MVSQLVEMMLRPFRANDAEEVRACLDSNGGVDKLRLTFFKEGDLGNDGVWDIWKVEGPAFSWYLPRFAARPHVAERGAQSLIDGQCVNGSSAHDRGNVAIRRWADHASARSVAKHSTTAGR